PRSSFAKSQIRMTAKNANKAGTRYPITPPSAAVQLCCVDATALAQRGDALGKTGPDRRDCRVRHGPLGVCGVRREVEPEVESVLRSGRVRSCPDRLLKATRELSVGARKEVSYRSIRLDD